jgi:hypothetical protein
MSVHEPSHVRRVGRDFLQNLREQGGFLGDFRIEPGHERFSGDDVIAQIGSCGTDGCQQARRELGPVVVHKPVVGVELGRELTAQVGKDGQAVLARQIGSRNHAVHHTGQAGGNVGSIGKCGIVDDGASGLATVLADQAERIGSHGVWDSSGLQPGLVGAVAALKQVDARLCAIDDSLQSGQQQLLVVCEGRDVGRVKLNGRGKRWQCLIRRPVDSGSIGGRRMSVDGESFRRRDERR